MSAFQEKNRPQQPGDTRIMADYIKWPSIVFIGSVLIFGALMVAVASGITQYAFFALMGFMFLTYPIFVGVVLYLIVGALYCRYRMFQKKPIFLRHLIRIGVALQILLIPLFVLRSEMMFSLFNAIMDIPGKVYVFVLTGRIL